MKRYVSAVALFAALLVCGVTQAALAQSVPSPWTAQDIGAPALSGSATYSSGTFTIDAAGTDIWSTSDQFHFVYQAVSGDVEIVARVNSLEAVHKWTNAGVMIRGSLSADAATGYTASMSANDVYFRRRLSSGASMSSVAGAEVAAPVWVRLVRTGNLLTSYSSTDGTSWTTIGSSTVSLSTSAYVGLAVSSRKASTRATAVFSNVTVTKLGGTTPPPLPNGQSNRDIGAPAIAGSTTYASGTYTIQAAGADIWDTADQFHFVHQQATGDVEVVARVASIGNTNDWAKAGVMVRESLSADARHASMFVSYANGYAFQRRRDPATYSVHTSGGTGAAPGWVKLVRTGDLFQAYRSTTGTTWKKISSDTIAMGDTVYVGLAVTSHNVNAATTAVVDNVKVTANSSPTNQSPTVSITSPANGASFTMPITVTISATAADPENRMASVDFYAGSTLIVRDTTAPYSTSWAPTTAGGYALTAVGHDQDGGSSTSSPVNVTVSTTLTPPKTVVFEKSADHSTSVTNYVLQIFAADANPATALPVATSDLGKPTPDSNGDITVDRSTFFSNLAVGSYLATVTAVGPGGQTQSASVAFTR